jgi:hypothetical protein
VIAARRLGHPCELAAEYSKNNPVISWERPARLALWGTLMFQMMHQCWGLVIGLVGYFGVRILAVWPGQIIGFWIPHAACWGALFLFWLLVEKSNGGITRIFSRLESALQTSLGALSLILASAVLVVVNTTLMIASLWLYTPGPMPVATMFGEANLFTLTMVALTTSGELTSTVPIVVLLVILIRAVGRTPQAMLATR